MKLDKGWTTGCIFELRGEVFVCYFTILNWNELSSAIITFIEIKYPGTNYISYNQTAIYSFKHSYLNSPIATVSPPY